MIGRFRSHLMLVVASFSLANSAHATPANNLLPNGSFEKTVAGKPEGWEPHRWSGVETSELARPGYKSKHCILIASDAGADFSLETKVPVEPFATYRLSGWIKTENVRALDGRGALLNVHDLGLITATPALTGTRNWAPVEVVFQTFGQDRLSISAAAWAAGGLPPEKPGSTN